MVALFSANCNCNYVGPGFTTQYMTFALIAAWQYPPKNAYFPVRISASVSLSTYLFVSPSVSLLTDTRPSICLSVRQGVRASVYSVCLSPSACLYVGTSFSHTQQVQCQAAALGMRRSVVACHLRSAFQAGVIVDRIVSRSVSQVASMWRSKESLEEKRIRIGIEHSAGIRFKF